MRKAVNLSAALSAVAAMVGAGFASGRELVVFFSGQGVPSWLGIAVACVGAGFLTGAISALARRTGRRELPGVFTRTMGPGAGVAMRTVYTALLILCAAAMLSTGATLGALTFPFHGSFLLGAGIVLASALLLTRRGALPVAGLALVVMMAAWYIALGVGQDETGIRVGGSVIISATSGMIYAAFNATVAAGVVCLNAGEGRRAPPRRAVHGAIAGRDADPGQLGAAPGGRRNPRNGTSFGGDGAQVGRCGLLPGDRRAVYRSRDHAVGGAVGA